MHGAEPVLFERVRCGLLRGVHWECRFMHVECRVLQRPMPHCVLSLHQYDGCLHVQRPVLFQHLSIRSLLRRSGCFLQRGRRLLQWALRGHRLLPRHLAVLRSGVRLLLESVRARRHL
jgi:hypothetical protein